MAAPKGIIALMGSGEFTATMVEVHKGLLGRLGGTPRAVFLDTPAGFQPNADQISDRAVEYFRDRVRKSLSIVSFKSAGVGALEAEEAYHALRSADFILVGPGSPTYAVRQWGQSLVPDILGQRVQEGACLVAASAAALTVGRKTLPVYEIYKVGETVHWAEGLHLLDRFGLDAVVVPHWNNAEGGTHDTRFCYMGEPRFLQLEAMLPQGVSILGVDEHTACILDLGAQSAEVRGIGRVTVRRGGDEVTFEAGTRFPLEALRGGTVGKARPSSPRTDEGVGSAAPLEDSLFWDRVRQLEGEFRRGLDAGDPRPVANSLLEVDRLLWSAQSELNDPDAISDAREVLREMVVLLSARLATAPGSAEECMGPLLEGLLALRSQWRDQEMWAEADAIRDCLQSMQIVIEDRPEGSRWRLAE